MDKLLRLTTDPAVLEAVKRHHSRTIGGALPGGCRRSANNGRIVTVFGCTGFLGRYVVNSLGSRSGLIAARIGTTVIVPFRGDDAEVRDLRFLGDLGLVVPLRFDLHNRVQIAECVKDAHCVLNLIGRDFDTAAFSQAQINVDGARAIAKACTEMGVPKLVHVSAIACSQGSGNVFLRTKARGELAVRAAYPDAIVVRPAVMFGYEDRILNPLGLMAVYMPRIATVEPATAVKMPTYVGDVAGALAAIALDDGIGGGRLYELVGPRAYTCAEIVQVFAKYAMREDAAPLRLSPRLYWLYTAMVRQWKRPMYRMSQIRNLLYDEAATTGLGYASLGIRPHTLESKAIELLRYFRPESYYHEGRLNREPELTDAGA